MIIVNSSYDASGNVVQSETRDTVAMTITYDPPVDGVTTKPLPPEEAAAIESTGNTNALTLEIQQNIDTLLLTVNALNEITSRTNSTINANPAATIKDLTREVKTVARQTIRIARILTNSTDSADSGS